MNAREVVISAAADDQVRLRTRMEEGWVPFAVTSESPPRVWLRRGARIEREVTGTNRSAEAPECETCGGDRFVNETVDGIPTNRYFRCPECNRG